MKTLEGILGLWGYCTQFRRPLLSFAFDLYHEAPPEGVGDPFRLSRGARNELLVLACLAPLCVTDLRAIPDDFIYCVDASPSGAGVCRTRVGREVCRELWRRGDKQGYRMPLLTSLSATLKGSGWDEEQVENWLSDAEAVCNEDDVAPEGQYVSFEGDYVTLQLSRGWRPEAALPSQLADPVFDFLELYAGCKRMSAAWARKGFSVLPPVELKDGLDLRDGELCFGLMRLIRRGGVRFLWWAPPCTTFSLARTPKLRNLQLPWGYDIWISLLFWAICVPNVAVSAAADLCWTCICRRTAWVWLHESFAAMAETDPAGGS